MKQLGFVFLICAWSFLVSAPVSAFYSNGRWTLTALDGSTGPLGTAVNVTWSLVADGTFIPGEGGSNLISFMDGLFGNGGGGTDLETRPWFQYFENSFNRWSELSGLTFSYEDDDDGANLRGLGGLENVRGDVRMGGAFIDGNGGTLGSTGFLNDADITIDTGDATYYGNPAPFDTYQNIHNTLMHEIGHAFGLGHIESNNAIFLMEPFTNAAINGPQLDDIRGIHHLYGDVNEKGNGNNTVATAIELVVTPGSTVLQGEHASTGNSVLMTESGFLSISNQNDFDYYSFEITNPALLDITVTPLGTNYGERVNSGDPFTTTMSGSVSNLSLELYAIVAGNPVLLATQNSNPIGQSESLLDFSLSQPGEYVFRVAGNTSVIQLYQFSLLVETVDLGQPGDFDNDGDVDGADFLAWQRGDSPNPFTTGDLENWQDNYGMGGGLAAATAVPELRSVQLCLLAAGCIAACPRCYRGTCCKPQANCG